MPIIWFSEKSYQDAKRLTSALQLIQQFFELGHFIRPSISVPEQDF